MFNVACSNAFLSLAAKKHFVVSYSIKLNGLRLHGFNSIYWFSLLKTNRRRDGMIETVVYYLCILWRRRLEMNISSLVDKWLTEWKIYFSGTIHTFEYFKRHFRYHFKEASRNSWMNSLENIRCLKPLMRTTFSLLFLIENKQNEYKITVIINQKILNPLKLESPWSVRINKYKYGQSNKQH